MPRDWTAAEFARGVTEILNLLERIIGGTIIDENQFKIRTGLPQNRTDGAKQVDAAVIKRGDDAEFRRGGH